MKYNRNYVHVKDNEVVLENGLPKFAPATLSTASFTYINPTAEQYAKCNYLPYDENPTGDPQPGYHWEPAAGYSVTDGRAHRNWNLVADPLPTVEDFDRAMEEHLTAERSARGYTTREPDAYLTSSVPRWKQDAEDWVAHRDAVMEYALEVMNRYAETGVAPTMDEFMQDMPDIVWTYGQVADSTETEVDSTLPDSPFIDDGEPDVEEDYSVVDIDPDEDDSTGSDAVDGLIW